MSTKIYNGYTFGRKSIFSIDKILTDFGGKARDLANRIFIEHLVRMSTRFIDKIALGINPLSEDTIKCMYGNSTTPFGLVARHLINTDRKAREDHRSSFFCMQCEVVIFPQKNKQTLALFYSDNREFTKLWNSEE